MSEEKPKKAAPKKSATRTNINLLIILLVILFLLGVAFVIYLFLDSQKKGSENREAIEAALNEPEEEKVTIDLSIYEAYLRIEEAKSTENGVILTGSVGQGEFKNNDIVTIVNEKGEQSTGTVKEIYIGNELVESALIGSNIQVVVEGLTEDQSQIDWYLAKIASAPVETEVIENPEEIPAEQEEPIIYE